MPYIRNAWESYHHPAAICPDRSINREYPKMFSIVRRDNWPILLIIVIGFTIVSFKCWIVHPVQFPGHFDNIAYADMADSLIHGQGFSADYVTLLFIKYPRDIRHPEDHWPPLHSIAIAPFFLLFGKTAFAGKLPSMLISSLFLPIAVYFLTEALGKSKIAGLCSALTIMTFPFFFAQSLCTLSDITYAFVVCLAVLFAIKGMECGRYFYPMGVCIGFAYYAKGSALVLSLAYLLFYVYHRHSIRMLFTDRYFVTGLFLAFLVVLPWFVRNTIYYRHPLHSTQNYVAGYIGWENWESKTFHVYWDEKPPSWIEGKLSKGIGKVAQMSFDYMKTYLWWMLMDITSRPPKKISFGSTIGRCFRGFPKLLGGIPMCFWGIPAILFSFFRWRNRNTGIIWLVSLSGIIFLSVFWSPIDRLLDPTIPLIVSLGWVSYHALFKRVFCWTRYNEQIVMALLCMMLLIVLGYSVNAVHHSWQIGKNQNIFPYADGKREQAWMDVSRWLKDNVPPDSVIMAHEPKSVHYFSELKTVKIPYDDLKNIIRVMKYYRVTHIIPCSPHICIANRPQLKPLLTGEIPFFLIYDGVMKVYKVRYDLLPSK